jgi:hypothetical protein
MKKTIKANRILLIVALSVLSLLPSYSLAQTSQPTIGLSPSTEYFNNVTAGSELKWGFTIASSYNTSQLCNIVYRLPSTTKAGFSMPPKDVQSWLRVPNSPVSINASGTATVSIALTIPLDAKLPHQWEFWVSMIPASSDMVQIEVCQRCFVTMQKASLPMYMFAGIGAGTAGIGCLAYLLRRNKKKPTRRKSRKK